MSASRAVGACPANGPSSRLDSPCTDAQGRGDLAIGGVEHAGVEHAVQRPLE